MVAPALSSATRPACSTGRRIAARVTLASAGDARVAAAALGARRPATHAPPNRRHRRPATASAAAAVDAAADQWLQATGVPVLQQMQAGSLHAAVVLGAQVLVGLAAATVLGQVFLRWADARVAPDGSLASTDASSWVGRTGRYLLSSLLHQARVLLPWLSGLCAATTMAALLQVSDRQSRGPWTLDLSPWVDTLGTAHAQRTPEVPCPLSSAPARPPTPSRRSAWSAAPSCCCGWWARALRAPAPPAWPTSRSSCRTPQRRRWCCCGA